MTTKFTQDSPAEGSRETVEKALAHASDAKPRSKIAETARLEREQGGQPQAHDSGDPAINAQPPKSRQGQK
jgi:hypothetical protein